MTVGATGLAAAVTAQPSAAQAADLSGGWLSATTDLGLLIGDSTAATTNTTALRNGLTGTAAVCFPAGDYYLDNSAGGVTISGFSGQVLLLPGARLVFTSNTVRGLNFSRGTGARISGLSTAYVTAPSSRVTSQETVIFDQCTDPYLENVRIAGSASVGVMFWRCVRPSIVAALTTDTMAEGVHFANCQDGFADHVTVLNCGDDGLAFVNYADLDDNTGGLATNISVTNSKSRGIAIVGQSGVTVRDVRIDTTVGHGLYCAHENKTSFVTRVPGDCHLERVTIRRGGVAEGQQTGPNSGLRIASTGTVTAALIRVDSPGSHGAYVSGATTTVATSTGQDTKTSVVTLTDVSVTNAPGSGVVLQGGVRTVDRIRTAQTGSVGFNVSGCTRLDYGTVSVENAATNSSLRRAVTVENTPQVLGARLWVVDTQATATGYIVGAYGTQKGNLGTIFPQIASRALSIENTSGLGYSLI